MPTKSADISGTTAKSLPKMARKKDNHLHLIHVEEEESAKSRIRLANEISILDAAERVFAGAGFDGATMAQIAEEARLPKPNLHYYFENKGKLYLAVLRRVLGDWLDPIESIAASAEPKAVLEHYVRTKTELAFSRPHASRVFANELLHGAPVVGDLLRTELREVVARKAAVIDGWIAEGRMAEIDSTHLFFTIWAMTQTYADFEVQIKAVIGRKGTRAEALRRATDHVLTFTLRACGLA